MNLLRLLYNFKINPLCCRTLPACALLSGERVRDSDLKNIIACGNRFPDLQPPAYDEPFHIRLLAHVHRHDASREERLAVAEEFYLGGQLWLLRRLIELRVVDDIAVIERHALLYSAHGWP